MFTNVAFFLVFQDKKFRQHKVSFTHGYVSNFPHFVQRRLSSFRSTPTVVEITTDTAMY